MKLHRNLHVNPAFFGAVPLVNVLFLVIIFFAMSARFVLQPGVAIALPVSSFTLGPQPRSMIVSVTSAPVPTIYFRGRKVTIEELRKLLTEAAPTERSLIIKADRNTPYELVMQLSNEGLKLGFSVVLATSSETK